MGLFRWLSRTLIIALILNIIDTVICILWPLLENNLHFYPSMTETFGVIITAPWLISTHKVLLFQLGRAIILCIVLATLVAIVSEKKTEAAIYYEFMILLLTLIVVTLEGINQAHMNPASGSLIDFLLSYIFWKKGLFILSAMLYHIPFSFLSLLIFVGMRKYREFITELKIIGIPHRKTR